MHTVADIMTKKVVSIGQTASLYEAQQLMRQHDIRHIPVLDPQGRLVGMLSQKAMLNSAFAIVEQSGASALSQRQQQISVASIMDTQVKTIPVDTSLVAVGQYFILHKHGCLPVVDDQQLCGIISSMDFVKLSVALLQP